MSGRRKVEWLRRSLVDGPFLALCTTEAQFRQVLRKLGVQKAVEFVGTPHSHATAHAFEHPSGNLACVVCLRDAQGRDPVQVAGLLVHEAVHVWQQFRDHIGELAPSREFEAYAIQAVAERLMNSYVRQTGGAHAQVDPA